MLFITLFLLLLRARTRIRGLCLTSHSPSQPKHSFSPPCVIINYLAACYCMASMILCLICQWKASIHLLDATSIFMPIYPITITQSSSQSYSQNLEKTSQALFLSKNTHVFWAYLELKWRELEFCRVANVRMQWFFRHVSEASAFADGKKDRGSSKYPCVLIFSLKCCLERMAARTKEG